jgi:adenosylcobinamide hydrolase
MESHLLKTGGTLCADDQTIICRFPAHRLALSTSLHNGGYLMAEAVFNHRLSLFVNSEADLPGGNLENYLALVADERGLNCDRTTGLLTSAEMHCRGYHALTYKNLTVETVATAGVDQNAARAGDCACYYEDNGRYHPIGGTINILTFTNAKLAYGTLAKALVTITEAKTSVLQELAVKSSWTQGSATGTGTDGVIITSDPDSPLLCTDAGTQSKLGELLCLTVRAAVKQALALQCKIDPRRQGSVQERLRRLELTMGYPESLPESGQARLLLAMSQSIWQEYCWGLLGLSELYQFLHFLEAPFLQPLGISLASALRAKTSALRQDLHLQDGTNGDFFPDY